MLKGKNKAATGRNGSKPKNRNNRIGRRLDPELTTPPKNGESKIKYFQNKKRYWCTKCARWTMSHPTDGHKSIEELKRQGRQQLVSSARVDLDFHPAAFSAIVRKEETPSPTVPKELLALSSLAGLLTLLVVSVCWNELSTLMAWVVELIKEQWLWMFTATASGIISGLSTWCVAQAVPEPEEPKHYMSQRIRTGPKFIKHRERSFKRWTRNSEREIQAKKWKLRNEVGYSFGDRRDAIDRGNWRRETDTTMSAVTKETTKAPTTRYFKVK